MEMKFDGVMYRLLTDDERNDELLEHVKETFEYFNHDFIVNHALDEDAVNEFFTEIYTQWNEGYADDIESESDYTGQYDSRLEQEMADAGVETKEDFVEWMTERQMDDCNGLQYYIDNFGHDEAMKLLKENSHRLIDFEEMAKQAVRYDGYGHFLNSYDGTEIEVEIDGEDYFAYRV